MNDYLLKLKILFPAHFALTLGMVPVYGLLRYLTLVPINPRIQYQFMSVAWHLVLPALLLVIPYFLFYQDRVHGIIFRYDSGRGQDSLSIISYFTGVVLLLLTSMYVEARFGHEIKVASPAELSESAPGNFYTIDEFTVPRNWGTFFTDVSTSGRTRSRLHFDLLFASPFLNHASEPVPDSPKFWYGVRHRMTISNRVSQKEKDAALKDFQEESLKKMETWDFQKVAYFKRVPKSEDLFNYNRAISNRIGNDNKNQFVILEAVNEPFADRAGSRGIWIFNTWLIGTGVLLLALLAGRPVQLFPKESSTLYTSEKSWINQVLASFQFDRDYIVTPVFAILMLSMTILMACCGVVGGYLDNPALEYWGGLRRPEVANGAWWRLFTYGFSSPGPLIGLMNITVFILLGKRVEKVFGSRKTLVSLVVALLAGGIFSLYIHPAYWVAGSSPLVLASCVSFLMTPKLLKDSSRAFKVVICMCYMLLAAILGFFDYMEQAAHLGAIIGSTAVVFSSRRQKSAD